MRLSTFNRLKNGQKKLKHLKTFESTKSESESEFLNSIKDLFLEYIDDYDIDHLKINTYIGRTHRGLYYDLFFNLKSTRMYSAPGITLSIFGEETYKYELLMNDIKENFIPRLESIGYSVSISSKRVNWPSYGVNGFDNSNIELTSNTTHIKIDFSDLYSEA